MASLLGERGGEAKELLRELEQYFLEKGKYNDPFRQNTVGPLLKELLTKEDWNALLNKLTYTERTKWDNGSADRSHHDDIDLTPSDHPKH